MGKAKILICDDEALIRFDMQVLLEREGYDVTGLTESAVETLDVLYIKNIDLAILDINIKGKLNGIELAGLLKSVNKNFPVIFITGTSPEVQQKALTSVPNARLISKPYNEVELLSTIKELLTRS